MCRERARRPRPRSRPGRARGRIGARRRSRARCPSARRCAGSRRPWRPRVHEAGTQPRSSVRHVDTLAGTALALAAATMFGLGTVLQAEVAAAAPAADALRVRLLVRLARSPRWLVGAVATLVGWSLQVAALLLAPVTVVQPALAFTVVAVVVLAWAMTDERLGRRDTAAACVLAAGIGGVAALSPARSAGHADARPLAAVIVVLAIAG